MPEKEIIIEIALERLRDFTGSPFSVAMDEPMEDLIESIQTYGILNPLIVRPMPDGCYQIIFGHRRKFAAVKLRYWKVPVIIRALNDDEALVAMVDSNLQREKILRPMEVTEMALQCGYLQPGGCTVRSRRREG